MKSRPRIYFPEVESFVALNSAKSGVCRFGSFEFDPQTGELRKQGLRVRLEGQPVAILATLLERHGELVTREQLQKKLWPGDTFVDFEQSLNAAVRRLRLALDDSAESPTTSKRWLAEDIGGWRLSIAPAGPRPSKRRPASRSRGSDRHGNEKRYGLHWRLPLSRLGSSSPLSGCERL